MSTSSPHRLPRAVTPSAYKLELRPNLGAAAFSGHVEITAAIHERTTEIVLNAADLEISAAEAHHDGNTVALEYSLDQDAQRLTLTAPQALTPGALTLSINFDGELNDKLRGFYRSTYSDAEGNEQTIAVTQFESTNARRAFPCWDEPDLKATFEVALVVDKELMAVSSGPEVGREPVDDHRVRVSFAPTMVMSTYLLAFVVGPLVATEPIDVDGVPLRVIHPPGSESLTDFALEAGAFSLQHFSDYFEIPYPGEKLDLVGLPDFAFGAMENLGCVTFREALLLLDESETTKAEQQRVGDVIAHEIAHMWFGDLVTMEWWNGIWLKEAFATFCEMHATNAWKPGWKRWEDFGLSRSTAFDRDSLQSTRPIEFPVHSPDDAEAMYDVLTYEKGAAVVRMLEQYLGEEAFREGIVSYLKTHAYGNTETHHLWDAIEAETGQPARQIMDSWIFQGGYPVVSIEQTSPTTLTLTQRRFTYNNDSGDQLWTVPMVLVVGAGGTRKTVPVLLSEASQQVEVGPHDWVIGNAGANGFYRVELDAALAASSVGSLQELTAVERYNLVDDLWASTLAGQVAAADTLQTLSAVADASSDAAVWTRVASMLTTMDRHLDGEQQAAHRQQAVEIVRAGRQRIDQLKADATDNAEASELGEVQATLLETAGLLGDPEAIGSAREVLDGQSATPEQHAAAVRVVASNGDAEDFNRFRDSYLDAETPQEQRRYLFALPRFRQGPEVQAFLAMLEAQEVRSQDGAYVLAHALINSAATGTVWAYIEDNWDTLLERFPDNSIARMLEGVTAMTDPQVADRVKAFFTTHEVPQAGKTLHQHLERMDVSVALGQHLRSTFGPTGGQPG